MGRRTKIFLISFLFIIAVFVMANFSFAQVDTGMEYGEEIGLGSEDLRVIIVRIVRTALGFLSLIAVLIIMYGGWLWMSSNGDEAKIDKARQTLKNAVIGLAIILSSFAIASFILNRLGSEGVGGTASVKSPVSSIGGIGALGDCSIESVYPEPSQKEVPRNTSIIVTFREEIDPATVCEDSTGDGIFCNCAVGKCDKIIPSSVKISETESGNIITNAYAQISNDKKTFVFIPVDYLGSPSEYIWHTVYLSNDIEKTSDGKGVFSSCRTDYFEWSFEVSNIIDLEPPKVLESGIFPVPDKGKDQTGSEVNAIQADGRITLNSQPQAYSSAKAQNPPAPQGLSESVSLSGDYNCKNDGVITVAINGATNQADVSGPTGVVSGDDITDNVVSLGCGLNLTPDDGTFAEGNSWTISVASEKQADILTVGSVSYPFIANGDVAEGYEIEVGFDLGDTAQKIANSINGLLSSPENPDVDASVSVNSINLLASVAGLVGNNIVISSTNISTFIISPMEGGQDAQVSVTVVDKKDKPKNAVIQINFNEAINPITVSGSAGDLREYIRIENLSSGEYLDGKFLISNQYRTVEFISDDLCGVNGCGESIYCLPENSNLRVELFASILDFCSENSSCVSKSPYNNCSGNICKNSEGENFPLSELPLSGIVDAALNSLDGNRDDDSDGPVSFYDENSPDISNGDNYSWSFFINDKIDLSPPKIISINPSYNDFNVSLSDPIVIDFNKLMMASSLKTGSIEIFNGSDNLIHQLINLWNFTNKPVGYWATSENKETGIPDGEPDLTSAEIKHSMFSDATSYRAQVGSGVKTIYQNCFNPSSGPGCSASNSSPSCCSGTPTEGAYCP